MIENSAPKVLVVGVGDPMRGDDGIGAAVIEALRRHALPESVRLLALSGEGTELMQAWEGVDWVVLVDAANATGSPGTAHRFDAITSPLPTDRLRISAHLFGPTQAIELARTLDTLPPRLDVYAVEGENFALGSGLSAAIEPAVHLTAEHISKTLVAAFATP